VGVSTTPAPARLIRSSSLARTERLCLAGAS
jgi:hypothetical protein